MADGKDPHADDLPGSESESADPESAGEELQTGAERGDGGSASDESLDAPSEVAAPPSVDERPRPRPVRTAWLVAVLVLAGFTIAVASAWYLTTTQVKTVSAQIRDTNARLKAALAEREKVQARALAELAGRVDEARIEAEELRATVAALARRVADVSRANPTQLVLTELEYLLQLADYRARLEYDAEGAIAALTSAQARVEALTSERYDALRAQISADTSALESFTSATPEDVTQTLSRLLSRVDELEMETEETAEEADTPSTNARLRAGWHAFVAAVRDNLGHFIEVRRADGSVVPTVIPDQEFFARENLRLALQSARLAALRRDTNRFRLSLREAGQWLAYFPAGSAEVSGMLSEIDGLNGLDLEPPLPAAARSLAMVRELLNPASLLAPSRAEPEQDVGEDESQTAAEAEAEAGTQEPVQ